jgi:serine/threonine-protein kinase
MALENEQLGDYRLISLVGRGGMAEVWLAIQLRLNREVAVKVIKDTSVADDEMNLSARFAREAHSIAHLDHPNILPVLDYGSDKGYLFLAMPYLRGGSLQERIKREPLARAQAFDIFGQTLSAVAYAHSKGIIHRDLKPANILLYDQRRAVIADFGVAKTLSENVSLTQTGAAVGSPLYMAPEQFRGQADFRADLYSLGVILYQLLTGRVLYSGTDSWEIAMKHINDPLPLPDPTIPPALNAFLLKSLSKRAEDRFSSAGEMEAAFHRAAGSVSPQEMQYRPPLSALTNRAAQPGSNPGSAIGSQPSTTSYPGGTGYPGNNPQYTPNPPIQYTPNPPSQYGNSTAAPVGNYTYQQPSTGYGVVAPPAPTPVPPPAPKKKGLSPLLWVGIGLAALVLVGGIIGIVVLGGNKPGTTQAAVTTGPVITVPVGARSLKVAMAENNKSGASGFAVITDLGGGKIKVEIDMVGLSVQSHNAHLHSGTCQAQGPVEAPLPTVTPAADGKGKIEAIVEKDFNTVTGGNFYLNVHGQGQKGSSNYIDSCGDIAT